MVVEVDLDRLVAETEYIRIPSPQPLPHIDCSAGCLGFISCQRWRHFVREALEQLNLFGQLQRMLRELERLFAVVDSTCAHTLMFHVLDATSVWV